MRPTFALTCLLALGACGGDGDTRVCFGSVKFCEHALGRNFAPEADAGPDRQVPAGEVVELDGTESFDSDGSITSYSWTQRAGDPVALTDADRAIAVFTAPAVTDETTLEFRLVVTDDDDASDDDHVRVTVVPAQAAALETGVRLLKAVYHPPAARSPDGCAACWSYLGLWLGARAEAARAGADDNLDALLDALRMIEQLHAGPLPVDHLPAEHAELFRLGQRAVAEFTARRDPATAEIAAAEAATTSGAARSERWRRAVLAVYPQLGWFEPTPAGRRRAIRLLLETSAAPAPPEALAAATLLLALPDHDGAASRRTPSRIARSPSDANPITQTSSAGSSR